MCGGSGGGDPPPDPAVIAAAIKAALARSTVDIPDDDVTEVTTPGTAGSNRQLHSAGHAGQPFPVADWTLTRRAFFLEGALVAEADCLRCCVHPI